MKIVFDSKETEFEDDVKASITPSKPMPETLCKYYALNNFSIGALRNGLSL